MKIKIGNKVNYHAVIGEGVTSTGHTVKAIELMPNNYGSDVAWITGKSGCVCMEALSLAPKKIEKARSTIEIPAPVANLDDPVSVENYRKRPPVWERGTVVRMSYKAALKRFYWSYEVRLNREAPKGGPLFLYVGDESLRTLKGEEANRG